MERQESVDMPALTEEQLPALFKAANSASLRGQHSFLIATQLRLGALLFAAALGATVGEIGPPDWFAAAAVAGFIVAVGVELYLLVARPERTWYEGRAAAESVKSLAWRYAVGGQPFPIDVPNVDKTFLSRLREILTDLHQVTLDAGVRDGEQISHAMQQLRGEATDSRRAAYRLGRIDEQRDWYARKSEWNDARARRLRLAAIALEGAGLLAGILTIVGYVRVDLLSFFAAATATVAAWLQTKQHETLGRAYAITSQELALVRSDWNTGRTEEEWAQFIDKAEEAISSEHTLWRASRGVEASWQRRRDNNRD